MKIRSLITVSKNPAVTEFCIIFEKKSFLCAVMNVRITLITATVIKSKIIFTTKKNETVHETDLQIFISANSNTRLIQAA